jgi:hypoxanthine phosphoribosyltransferase
MSWDEFFEKLQDLQKYWEESLSYFIPTKEVPIHVYGIPRGGMIVASFCKGWIPVHRPELAHVIIDDIVDSGRTKRLYENKYKLDKNTYVPVTGLIDKVYNIEHKNLGWVFFPWEMDKDGERHENDDFVRILERYNVLVTDENIDDLKNTISGYYNFDDR